ncbi:MAG: DUF58 domain-containing protein [Clostridiales bacterium]|jgi:uncharacterized protein (DUF58 family)|nr:DUF58 domain-containing protein [Clostridiales bacterium]
MGVTKKFIISALIALPFLAALPNGGSAAFFALFNAALVLTALVDFFRTPSAKSLVITREPYDKLFFKARNTVRFTVRNASDKPLKIALKDQIPDFHFVTGDCGNMTRVVPPHEEEEFSYEVSPGKRGSFMFPAVYVKIESLWGFCFKFGRVSLPMDFKVYPNLKDLGRYRLLMTKSVRLESGRRVINTKGQGTEFESLREYVEGDDCRKLSHTASARARKLIINQFEAEKNQIVFAMIDAGRAMSYTLKGYKKLDYAINAALVLSDIVNGRGDKTGLVVFGKEVSAYIPPGKGAGHRNELMEALYHVADSKDTPDYAEAFRQLVTRQKRRGIVFIFTDFETDVELADFAAQARLLRTRHIPVVVLMKNDSVLKMAAEAGPGSSYRRSVAREYLEKREKFKRTLNLSGVVCVESDSEDFALDTVNNYLRIKAKMG